MMHITEDTPPDMLAGAMDLVISLPDGRDVKMSVERSTPMMDLLVQVTTAYKLRPSDHLIQAMDMSGGGQSDRVLPYKPNTPIGALDTQNIRVLPKGRTIPAVKNIAPGHQPFESTFRLQVHLPRNQFCVIRVGKQCLLEDIMKKVCEEKNLDPKKYEFRHPANIDRVLDPKRTLNDYEITEITVVPRGSGRLPQTLSSTDIMSLQREEEKRKMQAKTGGGVLNLIFRRGRNSMGSGSISSDTRSISPTQSDDSRSVTPPAVQPPQILPSVPQEQTQNRPKPPQRKRRPAPKPPQKSAPKLRPTSRERKPQPEKLDNGLTICHSRNSSDSSGYHEASILSDNCNTTLPRRPKSTLINSGEIHALGMNKTADFSKSMGNLSHMVSHSKSTTSLTTAGRKKKAPPPPPVMKSANSVANITITSMETPAIKEKKRLSVAEVVGTPVQEVVSTRVKRLSTESVTPVVARDQPVVEPKPADSSNCPTPSMKSARVSASSTNSPDNIEDTEPQLTHTQPVNGDTSHVYEQVPQIPDTESVMSAVLVEEELVTSTPRKQSQENTPVRLNDIHKELPPLILDKEPHLNFDSNEINELEAEWQYQLPSPPKAFRDSSPTNFTDLTNYDTITFNGLSADSIITPPPPSFGKDTVKEDQSEKDTISEVDNTEPKVLTSKYLSLENLEKRKSLVLERELTSLKTAQTEVNEKTNNENILRNQKNNLISEVEEVIQNRNNRSTSLTRTNSQSKEKLLQSAADSTLPNFKITTYDQPKSKINIFEDDTIRSNVERRFPDSPKRNSMSDFNISFKPKTYEKEDTFLVNKRNSLGHTSTENLSIIKRMNGIDDELFKKPQEVPKFNKFNTLLLKNSLNSDSVLRSESFSQKNGWTRTTPVKRSKSQISLEKYKDEKGSSATEDHLQKSNSMWNVSGLQSLEVMRMILPKLGNSPPTSPTSDKPKEVISMKQETITKEPIRPTEPVVAPAVAKPEPEITLPKEKPQEPPKVYQYRGPPSINLGTWSERPKSQISLKEDQDYKISNIAAMKAKFNSQTNLHTEIQSKGKAQENVASVNIRVNGVNSKDQVDSGKINIKINSETNKHATQPTSGNVIIKIGNNEETAKPDVKNFYSRFLNQTTAVGYRKPLGNINGVDKPRPRSIAFDSSCPDISRVPIVRAVELKKPFKEAQSKSITHITHSDDSRSSVSNGDGPHSFEIPEYKPETKSSTLGNRFSSVYVSSENINSNQNFYSRPVSRVNSFAFTRPTNNVPVVKGFRIPQKTDSITDINSKPSWNSNHYGTLPSKSSITQNNTPFSQTHLKRTNHLSQFDKFSNTTNSTPIEKVVLRSTANRSTLQSRNSTGSFNTVGLPNGNAPSIPEPPAPPQLPKITSVTKKAPRQIEADPRDQLLSAIRSFGGKSGLKPVVK